MSRLKTILLGSGFFLVLAAGVALNIPGKDSLLIFNLQVNRVSAAIFMITAGVIFYFGGRLLGFILKFHRRND